MLAKTTTVRLESETLSEIDFLRRSEGLASVTAAIRYCVRQIYKLKNNKEVETNVPDV